MKKLFSVLILLVCIVGISAATSAATSAAAPADSGIFSMASYFPSDTPVFFAIRTDEAYIDALDAIIENAVANAPLPQEMPITTLREALEMGLREEGLSLADIYSWLGDYLALGATEIDMEGNESVGYFVLQITDRAAAEAFIIDMAGEGMEQDEEAGFTSFTFTGAGDGRVLVGDDILIVVPENEQGTPTLTREATLLNNESYQSAVETLPADSYNFALYLETPLIFNETASVGLEQIGIDPENLGPVAVAGTILDDYSLVLDVAQTGMGDSAVARIDPAFQQYLPSQTSAFIHATDLTALYTTTLEFIQLAAQQNGGEDPSAQIEAGLQAIGIDLEEDILSWTTGDYAIFARANTLELVGLGMSAGPGMLASDLPNYFDFGLVIEATDVERAETFTTKITTLLTAALSSTEEVTVADAEIAGFDVTTITVNAPMNANGADSETLELEFVIGVSDEVFFLGTRNAAEIVFAGEGGLSSSEGYQQASGYLLPDATSVWYADANGLIGSTLVPLTLLGPAIGNVFDNIVDEFEQPQAAVPQAVLVQDNDGMTQIISGLEYLNQLVGSSSISSTVTDEGATITRFVFSFNQQ